LLNVKEVNTFHDFLELEHVWNKVLAKSKDNNIFLTWEYLSIYWKHFGKGKRLRVLCIEDKDDTIAIAPLRQSRYGFSTPLNYEVIEPLGYRGLMSEGGDYTGLILGEKENECLHLILNYLIEHDNWDFIYMYDVPETSIIPDLLPKISKKLSITHETKKGVICPFISIPSSMDIFLKELNSKFRKNLRRCMKNLEKDYQRVELKRYDEFGSVEEAMKIYFELHQKRWKLKHMPGVFSTQEVRDFYRDVAKLFAENGWLALYFLTANDESIAVQYCFEYEQKTYYALSGFDPDYSRYSIGNLIMAKVIEECIARKIKEYDLLKGSEQYKFYWTSKYRRNLNIKFVNKRITSNLYNQGMKALKQAQVDKILGRLGMFS